MKLAGVAIIEAPRLYQAPANRGIGKAVDYSDAKKLDDGDAALVPANCIGRLLRGAAIIRPNLRSQGRRRPAVGRAPGLITMWWLSFLDGSELVEVPSLSHRPFSSVTMSKHLIPAGDGPGLLSLLARLAIRCA
jgi:hypothetical protein